MRIKKINQMEIFSIMEQENCREIRFHFNPETKMKALLVIDSLPKDLKNGTVSGGTRFAHKDADGALVDAIKLARAMTRKAKVLGVDEGGAKAVIIADNEKSKRFLESIGIFIQVQKGFFKTAIDMGFDLGEASIISTKTDFIDSLSHVKKGLGSTGENTAEGMVRGLEIICTRILKKHLKDCSFAVQGLGAVGMALIRRLNDRGCKIIATDINKQLCKKAEKLSVKIVKPDDIFSQDVDIFSPCAFGSVLNEKTIPKLRCRIIAGGANNQLSDEKSGEKQLLQRDIVFIPDFVLNCAGFLQALVERQGGTINQARKKSIIVAERLNHIINFSQKNNCTLLQASIKLFGGQNEIRN